MSDLKSWHNDVIGAKLVEALHNNKFSAVYVKNKEEAVKEILNQVPANASVGFGGSWTLQELGLAAQMEKRGNLLLNHNKPGLSPEEAGEIRKKQLTCDAFIASTNAVTLKGELVNVDGTGNRVAAMIYGPKKVIIVVGINKVVKDYDAAINRIQQIAAPMNNKRLSKPNPCVTTGECMNCQSSTRICNVTTILHKRPSMTDMQIIVVGEELGY